MIWFFVIVIIIAGIMGFFNIPLWIMYSVLAIVFVIFLLRSPLLFGKDTEKMMAYLKKSRRPYLQFHYYFLKYDLAEAEKAVGGIRPEKAKKAAEIMLLIEQKQFGKAKELVKQLDENKTKWYALANIAIYEGDLEAFEQNKGKIKDHYLLQTLEVDQAVNEGKRAEAIAMLDAMIPKLKGYKLLSVVQFRKHIQEGRI